MTLSLSCWRLPEYWGWGFILTIRKSRNHKEKTMSFKKQWVILGTDIRERKPISHDRVFYLEEALFKAYEEIDRLHRKWGWKKVKSAAQLQALSPGTYGFLDKDGNNYYGVWDVKKDNFYLIYIDEEGDACEDGVITRPLPPKVAAKYFTQYRQIHQWYPPTKEESEPDVGLVHLDHVEMVTPEQKEKIDKAIKGILEEKR